MVAVASARLNRAAAGAALWPLVAGLALLYLPSYVMAARTLWNAPEHAHGPLVLAVTLWAAWRERHAVARATHRPWPLTGSVLLALGLMLYVLGRSQDVALAEIGSQIPVFAGLLLLGRGPGALRAAWFPLVYLLFLIPLPGLVVDALTGPLKQHISALAAALLHAGGYPVARSGVMIMLGPYQLLVADACSGLNSMYSLAAVVLAYVYLLGVGAARGAVLLAAVPAIAFAANTARVLVLGLVTYHLGDAAGQGFLHDFAGLTLFAVALGLCAGLDGVLRAAATLMRRARGRVRAMPA